MALKKAKNRCVLHVHVCSFFQASSHDQLGDPYGGYTCYRAAKATYDVNQSAMEDGRIMGRASLNGAEEGKKQVCFACACVLFLSGAIPR